MCKSDASFTSSAVRTHAWSVFSGLSLSQVSMISAIALPLYLDEISNPECYTSTQLTHSNLQDFNRATTNGSTLFKGVFRSSSKPVLRKEDGLPLYKIVVLGEEDVGTTELVVHVTESFWQCQNVLT